MLWYKKSVSYLYETGLWIPEWGRLHLTLNNTPPQRNLKDYYTWNMIIDCEKMAFDRWFYKVSGTAKFCFGG